MRTGIIHLINPKTDSFTTRPLYMNRALYSPIAGLLAVAATIPRDRYEVVLTDENIEPIDFDLKADLVGISAMTSYVNRGYEIADAFRARGIPVVMGGVHPSFMPHEALEHATPWWSARPSWCMPKLLDDLEQGQLRGIYKADRLHPDGRHADAALRPGQEAPLRQPHLHPDLARLPSGLHLLRRAADERPEVPLPPGGRGDPRGRELRLAQHLDQRRRLLRHAGAAEGGHARPQGPRHPAGRPASPRKLAQDDRMLELAAESGCTMLSIGFESISRSTLTSVHKHVNRPETFAELVEKIHGYGIMVFGLFMFGFDGDDPAVFEETVKFNIDADYDACAYSVLTPYPGTLTWYEMKKANRIVSYDWDKYDQANVVYRPARMTADQLRLGPDAAYETFYSLALDGAALPRARRAQPHAVEHLQSCS